MENATGVRLREVRKRRGLSQRELADTSGVSLSLIRKLEQGDYGVPRLETLRKLAVALHVPTMRIVGKERESSSMAVVADDHWRPVRRALENRSYGGDPGEDGPTPRGVQKALDAAGPLFRKNQYVELALLLPPMLRDAEALGEQGRGLRARLYELAGTLMVQTRQFDAAEIAIANALENAVEQTDGAAAINTRCWLLLRQGKLDAALALAVRWADETEPRLTRATAQELCAWGLMCLQVAAASVRNNEKAQAEEALRMARAAAVVLGRDENSYLYRSFGPMNVRMKRVEYLSVSGQYDHVLQMADNGPAHLLRPGGSMHNRFILDVANAHAERRQYIEAFEKLEGIRVHAPEWLQHQRYARDVLGKVITGRRTLKAEMRTMADLLRLPL
ncbi:helix-turn-helix domain-containing protein [Streptomyces sp. NPDC057638]|uniref:helix-turn-helix domain-containing protein n=1 Tax=Streptomyces sp. NPDC057638 TaxID=3346190 RepID=UPI0036A2ED6E